MVYTEIPYHDYPHLFFAGYGPEMRLPAPVLPPGSISPRSVHRKAISLLNGADREYIGAEGYYGLGRVMVCRTDDGNKVPDILQW